MHTTRRIAFASTKRHSKRRAIGAATALKGTCSFVLFRSSRGTRAVKTFPNGDCVTAFIACCEAALRVRSRASNPTAIRSPQASAGECD